MPKLPNTKSEPKKLTIVLILNLHISAELVFQRKVACVMWLIK